MDALLLIYRAAIAASEARVAGMKAENEKRQHAQEAPAYDETAFFAEAHELDNLQLALRNLG